MSVEFSLTIVLVKQKKLAMFKVSGFPRRRFLLMSGLSAIGVGVVANAKGNAVTVEQSQRALDIGKQVYIWGLPTIDFNHSSLVRLNYTMNTMRWFTSRLIFTFIFSIILLVYVPTASAAANVDSSVTPPGGEKSAKTKILETGAAVLQNQTPVDAVNVYVDAFHFHNGNLDRQLEAHHYCSVVNEDFIQCVLYDDNSKNARLIGIEYIISGKSFQTLPEDEKKLWHSHVYEVKSGQLIAPGIPEIAEHALMEKIASTYGKIWHTWNVEEPNMTLPLGQPALMVGFTADGQANPALVENRDKRFNISTQAKKLKRTDISSPPIQPGADAWQTGQIVQLQLVPLSGTSHITANSKKE